MMSVTHSGDQKSKKPPGKKFAVFYAKDLFKRENPDDNHMPAIGLSDGAAEKVDEAYASGFGDSYVVRTLFSDKISKLSITYVWFKPNFPFPRHSHNADCLYYVLSGEAHVGSQILKAGDGFFVPCDRDYSYSVGPGGAEVLEFRNATDFHIDYGRMNIEDWAAIVNISQANSPAWREADAPLVVQRMMGAVD